MTKTAISASRDLSRRELDQLIRRLRDRMQPEGGDGIPRRPDPGAPAPLSAAQERLWFLDRLEGSRAYHVAAAVELEGELDLPALAAAFAAVVARHEVLRSRLLEAEGRPVQVVGPAVAPALPVIDLSGLAAPVRAAEAGRRARAVSRHPFDLAAGPLLRLAAFRRRPDRTTVVAVLHHTVCDGWSLGVLVRELGAHYRAGSAGAATELPALPVQYADVAAWERGRLERGELDDQLAYWRERLDGVPPLSLPFDRPRPARRSGAGRRLPLGLGAAVGARVEALAARLGTTPFAVLLAALEAYLGRITGQDDFAVGAPVANRGRPEVQPLIGFFAQTLVLRAELGGDPSFEELVGRVVKALRESLGNQEAPFERVVALAAPGRPHGAPPLFQVLLAFQSAPRERLDLPGLAVEVRLLDTGTAKFDLGLSLLPEDEGLEGTLEYDADLFDATSARRIVRGFETLLSAALEAPERTLGALTVLPASERHQLLREWGTGRRWRGIAGTAVHRVAEVARRTPDAVAVCWHGGAWSYRELAARAGGLALELRARGAGAEVPVGLLADRSADAVAGLLGIHWAGAVAVPFDPTAPAQRSAAAAADCGLALMVAAPGAPDSVAASVARVALPAARVPSPPPPAASPDHAAYLVFTSGSTGRPKGVVTTHRALLLRLLWPFPEGGAGGGEVVVHKAPGAFDFSLWEVLAPLVAGARLVLAAPGEEGDSRYLARLVARERATAIHFVPPLLEEFVDACVGSDLGSLRRVFSGGDRLPAGLRDRFLATVGVPLVNQYGPTEAAIDVTRGRTAEEDGPGPVPVGRPGREVRLAVVDRHLRALPAGVPGELTIAGPQLARCYVSRPALTAERFVPDPWSDEVGGRLYRTGDRGRLRADGRFEVLGRLDRQVKLRGFRVEPGEVEAVLGAHPAVRECVVALSGDDRGGRLTAYVVPTPGCEVSPAALERFVAERLPAYMVPSDFVELPELPRTPLGKLDLRSLPAPGRPQPDAGRAGGPPLTPMEGAVASTWERVLGLEVAGRDADFFQLGGHSLLAVRAASLLGETLGAEVPLRLLFEARTVAAVAAGLVDAAMVAQPEEGPGRPAGRRGEYPLSWAQQRLWFLYRYDPGSPQYNLAGGLRLVGRLRAGRLARAISAVSERHEALRTRFEERDGEPVQVVAEASPVPLPVVDLSRLPAERRAAEARAQGRAEARAPFDLERGPVLRIVLVRSEERDHTLLATMHHIVSDGWSIEVLLREMGEVYRAGIEGRRPELPELPLSYGELASRQRLGASTERRDRDLAYWRRRLDGAPHLDLPGDRPRPPARSGRGDTLPLRLAGALRARLDRFAADQKATPFMVLLAAYAALLSRYTGQRDVVVGTPVAGRSRREAEPLIGFFVNALPLRLDLSGSPGFRVLARRAAAATLEAMEHQELPFERLVEELAPERDPSRTPLFQVVLALQAAPASIDLPDLRGELLRHATGTAKFDLSVSIEVTPRGDLRGDVEYSRDLFDAATVRRFLAHWETLLERALAEPDRPVEELDLLRPAERQQLLVEWRGSRAPYPRDATLWELFEAAALARPQAPALDYPGVRRSYGELRERALSLGCRLADLGAEPGSAVAICLAGSAELVEAILGALAAGAVYVPLDPAQPEDRLRYMASAAGTRVLVTRSAVEAALEHPLVDAGVPVLRLDRPGDPEAAAGGHGVPSLRRARPPAGATAPAHVMFTSGSTGRPKGVLVTHRGVARLVRGSDLATIGPDDRVAQAASPSFDASTWEIWSALANGACLVGIPRETLLSPRRLAEELRERRVTAALLTTAVFDQLAREVPAAFAAMRCLIFGGEAAPGPAVRRVLESGPPARLVNAYGPTEIAVVATCQPVTALAAEAPSVPIGRPIANSTAYLVDGSLRPVPLGVPGELLAGGDGVAAGYHGLPAATAERFLPDQWSERPGARLYRTGDLARRLPDGRLDFTGRIDDQVKIRGVRVEPGEVEEVLSTHSGVARCVVLVAEGPRLLAFVVPVPGARPPAAILRDHARRRLPAAMVPASVTVLDALPVTAGGKVDRRALLALEAPVGAAREAIPPRTPAEEAVVRVFAELLDAGTVGVHDDFFDLGGHSLLAHRVVSRLRREYRVELPLRTLFEARTVEGVAAALEGRLGAAEAAVAGPVRRERQGPLPLSFAQQRLWFLDRLDPGSSRYNVPAGLRLRGALDTAALAATLGEIVRRHEALRTRFEEGEGGAGVQVVEPPLRVPLPAVDLSRLPAGRREDSAERASAAEGSRPFDLARAPLLRASLVRLEAADHRLTVTLHHVVSDGWSVGILCRELAALYPALAAGRPPALSEPPLQYGDFALWQRERLRGEVLDALLAYWRDRLAGMPPLDLPADRPRPASPSGRGGLLPVSLPPKVSAGVASLARRTGATLYAVLVAALEALVHRITGQRDFGLGSAVANRGREEIEGVVGFFVNTLVLRSDLRFAPEGHDGGAGFGALVRRVARTTVEALEHQDVPFERLVEELAPDRDAGRTPLFQVMMALQPELPEVELPGLEVVPFGVRTGATKFDLTLNLRDGPGAVAGTLEYAADLFDRTTVERFWRGYVRLLAAALEAPEKRIDELPLLAAAERHQLLLEWAGNETFYPRQATVPELFAATVAEWPDAVAVACGPVALSYGELGRRADVFAAGLRRMGAGPEVPVGLLLERSPEMVVATLAVLAAGSYYVPLEPSYPPARVLAMLADAGAPILVSRRELLASYPDLASSGFGWRGETVLLDARQAPEPPAEEVPPKAPLRPEGLCYVMYTSGSTGRPKGVAVPHRAVLRLVRQADFARLDAGETFLHLAPSAFDAATLEIWGPLLNGGRLEIQPAGPLDLEALGRTLRERRVTSAWLTAGLFHRMVEERVADLDGLRQLLAGGDVLSPVHVRTVLARRTGTRLVNGYGPTENTTFTACHGMAAAAEVPAPVPVGRPVADTRVAILDGGFRPVPAGVAGELCAAGDGLARGYLGRPVRTAGSFLPHPEPRWPGERLYRTGDLARWRPDGILEFLGRRDHQVKIRGFRVELGEVEAALSELPGVAQAAAAVTGLPGEERRLVGYVAPAAGAGLDAEGLRAALRGRLPEAMVPSAVVVLAELPLDPNGKVDRNALRALPPPAAAPEAVAPRTPEEARIAALFAEVLEVGGVGVSQDFFELGGHSLKAAQLVSRVRAECGVELPVRALFETPTVEGVARAVAALGGGPSAGGTIPRVERRQGVALPLSFSQERLWILDRIEPGSPAYVIPMAVRLTGSLDRSALAAALSGVVARHEALRTRFGLEDGRPVQWVEPAAATPLPVVDLGRLPAARRPAELDRLLARSARRPIDLGAGRPLRACLVAEREGSVVLQLVVHHIVADGWSLGVLVRELGALYRAAAAAAEGVSPEPLPPLPIQSGDFAAWQRGRLGSELRRRQLDYWRRQLAGAPQGLDLPLDRPRPAIRSFRGGHCDLHLEAGLVERLRHLSVTERSSLFMVLLAAFKVLLQRLAGEDDVVVGAPVAGRDRREAEGLIGMFLNTLVLRTDLAGDPTFRELVGRVRETVLGAFAHQDVPFEMLIDELQPERDLSRTPLFQVFLNMLDLPLEEGIDFPGVTAEVLRMPEMPSKFDLTLYLRPVAGGLDLLAVYNAALFDAATARRFLDQFRAVLEQAAEVPDRPVGRLTLLREEERRLLPDPRARLGAEWRGSVPEVLLRTVRRTPDRVALVAGRDAWSYRALETWSGRLASRLVTLGVEKGDTVAVWAQRCASLAPAVLAVLRAGGAFVMLDPSYPPRRLVETLEAAGARAFVRLESAGPLPAELDAYLASQADCPRLDVPARPGRAAAAGSAGAAAPVVALGADDLAYVAFTSGSTGRPKGILGRHGPLTHFLPWQCERFGLGPDDRFTLLSGLAHDPLQRDLFTPLWLAATLVVPEPAHMAVPEKLRSWLGRERATVAHLTPAMGQVLTERLNGGSGRPRVVRAEGEEPVPLRRVFLVGDVLTRRDVDRLRRLAPDVSCVNLYGSTETQRAVGYHQVPPAPAAPPDAEGGREVLPLGRGMQGAQLLVLDPAGGLAAVGEVGEIVVRSPHLAAGYLEAPGLTAERFQASPFPGGPRDRIYRTGDLGRFGADGEVRFLGRADDQVKVRGFRIELGEVVARLGRVPGVRDAAVLVREDGPLGRRLAAYVVPEDGVGLETEAVRAHLRRELPSYLVPATCIVLAGMPLTPSLKLDRRALLAVDDRAEEAAVGRDAPSNEAERKIAAVVQDVLGLAAVGAEENFFELGGNSLLLIQVHGRLQEAFGREIPISDLFAHPTVRSLAAHLGDSGGGRAARTPATKKDRTGQLRKGRDRLSRLRTRATE